MILKPYSILLCMIWLGGLSASAVAQSTPGGDSLSFHFKNPPRDYSIFPFWSLNNTLDSAKLKWQIDEMVDKGAYGAFLHAREGLNQSATPYFSDGWWRGITTAVEYGHHKGFYTFLYDEDKWPSGSAGGRTIAANPERNIKKILRYQQFEILGPQTYRFNKPSGFFAAFAGRVNERGEYDYSTQVELDFIKGQEWAVPSGRWAIAIFTLIKDPDKQINYLDSNTVKDFINITHEAYYKRLGKYFGNTIPGIFFDEIYANSRDRRNNFFWSDDFSSQFIKMKGYDLKPFLPLLFFNDPKLSPSKRFDFFDAVRKIYGKAWFQQYANWAKEHGIWVTGHTTEELIQYIRQSDYFYTMGQVQVPCADNEDFRYSFPRAIDFYNSKQISSLSHMYGRQRVAAEALGSGGYAIPPDDYRYGFSMLGVYGVNFFIPHLFHYSNERPENQADWPPSWFYENPYWKYFKQLSALAQRISFMVSQGRHECKIALLYPLTQVWLGGYSTPVNDEYYREVQQQLLNHHIDYDVIDPYSLSVAQTEDKMLKVGDEKYSVLVLPAISGIEASNMKKIDSFVSAGGTVVALKELPSKSEEGTPYDPKVIESVKKIFGLSAAELSPRQYYNLNREQSSGIITRTNAAAGKGYFTRNIDELPDIIQREIDPDVKFSGEDTRWIKVLHRKLGKKDLYFLVNSRRASSSAIFSAEAKGVPQLWDPESGDITGISNFTVQDGYTVLPLQFKPWGSYFIVIDPENPGSAPSLMITSSELDSAEIHSTADENFITGWAKRNGPQNVSLAKNGTVLQKSSTVEGMLPPILIENDWELQVAPSKLNHTWASSIEQDTLEVPIMEVRHEGNELWKTVKIKDGVSTLSGAARYLSTWRGNWITYYNYDTHLPDVGGRTVFLKKEFTVKDNVRAASADMAAFNGFEFIVNRKTVSGSKNPGAVMRVDFANELKTGKNVLVAKLYDAGQFLLDGKIFAGKYNITIDADTTWLASVDSVNWAPAFLYAAPPLGPEHFEAKPGEPLRFPIKMEYRQLLPPGARLLKKPEVRGAFEVYVNSKKISSGKEAWVTIPPAKGNINFISIKTTLAQAGDGLQSPLKILCGKVKTALAPWHQYNLGWYSGRAVYSNTVQIDAAYCTPQHKLVLDPGEVKHMAEIWVNDSLVTTRIWEPYTADISRFVKPGANKITFVVSNLLANQATWNMLDANISNSAARWWHYGSLMREKEQLVSGLLGPVRILPLKKEKVSF